MKPLNPGTLDLLVLQALRKETLHGYAIATRLHELSKTALRVEEGTLYPALHRMEREGWLESTWGKTNTGRRARFYSVTQDGAKHLTAEKRAWKSRTQVISRLLGIQLA